MKRAGEHWVTVATGRLEPLRTRRPSSAAGATWLGRLAALTVVGAIGVATPANAAVFWSDYDYGYSEPPVPMAPPHVQKPRKRAAKKIELPGKQAAKPQGPLIIAISINRQNLRIYDANGFFAETPISTGMRGHTTPMGAFSIIQKQKYHKSNIYSGAPMPYMQRITWSGIAMHAGVLPGYPASHGCIRMPMAFAVKMYGWTRMGARVVVTPGEMTPASFSNPLLATQKVAPQPMATEEPKGDKAVVPDMTSVVASASATDLELKPSVDHGDGLHAAIEGPAAPAPLSEQTHTADAGSSSATKATVTMSDATSSGTPGSDGASKDGATSAEEPARNATTTSKATKSDDEPTADVGTAASTADGAKPGEELGESPKAATDAPAGIAGAKKDQRRVTDTDHAVATEPDPVAAMVAKRTGPISVFISRKDAKLYVRQDFAPLFEVPVTIAPSDRPLGTHIFTAEADKNDRNLLRWSVVSLPAPSRTAERRDEDQRGSRRRKVAGVAEINPAPEPDSPTEALDRLTIPADAMARITDALSTGGSIIVSDQGIAAGETGKGTDFIVSLR
jgi:lipoprotein-anchoring transpeptidase ErfK/SrfK